MEAESLTPTGRPEPLLLARDLCKRYLQHRPFSGEKFLIQALDHVELAIQPGTTLALVGESGSGKSTLARCLARLEEPSSGEVWFEGKNLSPLGNRELFSIRRRIQLIFQDPAAALNPRLSAAEIVSEPLAIQQSRTSKERLGKALELMQQVGLSFQWGNRRPLEFSGGQRQRLAIARALALEPKFLILDEALSGLDLSIQAQIVNLLLELQASRSLTYLFIAHDLNLASQIADEIAVMHQGRIIERGRTSDLFISPRQPYTRTLLASIPELGHRSPSS